MQVNNIDPTIKAIADDVVFWQSKGTALSDTTKKIGRVREEWIQQTEGWLSTSPTQTRAHIENVRQIFSQDNPALENQALEQARNLKRQLQFTYDQIHTQTQVENHPAIYDQALEQIGAALKATDELLEDIGTRMHQRARGIPSEAEALSQKVQQFQKGKAAGASTAVSVPTKTIPASERRPYETRFDSSTAVAIPLVRNFMVGVGQDIDEALLGAEGIGFVAVPLTFREDVKRGSYFLNGQPLYLIGEPDSKAIEAYRSYCNALGGHQEGFAISTLLCQSQPIALKEIAQQLPELEGLFAGGEGNTFDVTLKKQNLTVGEDRVTVTIKLVVEGKSVKGVELSRKHAILIKREISFPLNEFKTAVHRLQPLYNLLETEERFVERETDAQREQRHAHYAERQAQIEAARTEIARGGPLLPSATAVDSYSSPIATSELGVKFLKEF